MIICMLRMRNFTSRIFIGGLSRSVCSLRSWGPEILSCEARARARPFLFREERKVPFGFAQALDSLRRWRASTFARDDRVVWVARLELRTESAAARYTWALDRRDVCPYVRLDGRACHPRCCRAFSKADPGWRPK